MAPEGAGSGRAGEEVDVDAADEAGTDFDVAEAAAVVGGRLLAAVKGREPRRGIPKRRVVEQFVGALPSQLVGRFLDRLTRPFEAERLLEELRLEGELPDVVAAIDAGELEQALELLLVPPRPSAA